jgi:hypothetical protein
MARAYESDACRSRHDRLAGSNDAANETPRRGLRNPDQLRSAMAYIRTHRDRLTTIHDNT